MNSFIFRSNELLICFLLVKEAIDSLWENQMEENDEGEDEENQLKKEILNKDRKALTSRFSSFHITLTFPFLRSFLFLFSSICRFFLLICGLF